VTIDLGRLPRRELRPGTQLYRIHAAEHGPWFFANHELGRFNPLAQATRGSCYWAEAPLGAWVEKFRTRMMLTDGDVRQQLVSKLELAHAIEVVDLTMRGGLAAGVTAALTAGASYDESQDVASRLQDLVSGVRYRVSHDLAQELIGVALFGPRGPQPESPFGSATTAPIGGDLIRVAEDAFGYRVLPFSAS